MIPLVRVRCQDDGNDHRANDPIHNPYTKTGSKKSKVEKRKKKNKMKKSDI